jgi:hypothetical protein
MSRSSAALLKIIEDPDTAREKLVLLTPKGEKFLSEMIAQGRNSIRRLVAHFSDEEVDDGIRFLRKVAARSRYKAATVFGQSRIARTSFNGCWTKSLNSRRWPKNWA